MSLEVASHTFKMEQNQVIKILNPQIVRDNEKF